jgi:hypothetical protein
MQISRSVEECWAKIKSLCCIDTSHNGKRSGKYILINITIVSKVYEFRKQVNVLRMFTHQRKKRIKISYCFQELRNFCLSTKKRIF